MLKINEQKDHRSNNTTSKYSSLNGAALINEEGREIPITPAMIEQALRALEQEADTLF